MCCRRLAVESVVAFSSPMVWPDDIDTTRSTADIYMYNNCFDSVLSWDSDGDAVNQYKFFWGHSFINEILFAKRSCTTSHQSFHSLLTCFEVIAHYRATRIPEIFTRNINQLPEECRRELQSTNPPCYSLFIQNAYKLCWTLLLGQELFDLFSKRAIRTAMDRFTHEQHSAIEFLLILPRLEALSTIQPLVPGVIRCLMDLNMNDGQVCEILVELLHSYVLALARGPSANGVIEWRVSVDVLAHILKDLTVARFSINDLAITSTTNGMSTYIMNKLGSISPLAL